MSQPTALFTPLALALVCLAELAALTWHPREARVLSVAESPAAPPVPADTRGLEAEFLARMTADDVARGAAALCRLDPSDPLAVRPDQRLELARLARDGATRRGALGELRIQARSHRDHLLSDWAQTLDRFPAIARVPR